LSLGKVIGAEALRIKVNTGGSASTDPRWIWASTSEPHSVSSGGITTSAQFPAFRRKTRIAGGRWAALAPVYLAASLQSIRSPAGASLDLANHTICGALEMSNGNEPTSYTSANTGGQKIAITWGGVDEILVSGGMLVIGDPIYASTASLPYFEFTNRNLLPWERLGVSKAAATDVLASGSGNQEYNAPWNARAKSEASFAAVKSTTMGADGSQGGGAGQYGLSTGSDCPGFIGWIGIPLSGQKATMFTGTSITQGTGDSYRRQGGVDPAGNTFANYDNVGFPSRWAEALTKSAPCMNFAVGASGAVSLWNPSGNDWGSASDAALSRELVAQLAQYFDFFQVHDPQNDNVSTIRASLEAAIRMVRANNPAIKIFSVRVPNGGPTMAGGSVAYDAGNLDPKYAVYDTLFAEKKIDYQLDLRIDGGNTFATRANIESGTTTALGTTTTLTDSTKSWARNFWVNQWVEIAGVKQRITANTATTLTFTAYGAAVASGVSYAINGNTSDDQLHPSTYGHRVMAANFETEQLRVGMNIPSFTRTK
jgi:hypothetical protein